MKIARRLQSTSLRYWILEYLRRQPEDKMYRAIILCFIKDRTATLLLLEVCLIFQVFIYLFFLILYSFSLFYFIFSFHWEEGGRCVLGFGWRAYVCEFYNNIL